MTVSEPVVDELNNWLHQLYGTADDGWLSFMAINRTTGERLVEWCQVADLGSAAEITQRLGQVGDVWNGVAIRTHRTSGRGGAAECGWLPGLWADIDYQDAGHVGNDKLPPDEAAAVELVRSFPVPPTAVVRSGGGLQAWWLFDEIVAVDDVGDLLDAFGATWAKVAEDAGYHVDNVFDLARIMRAPGTWNRKLEHARPVSLAFADWTRRYGVSEIRDRCIDPPTPTIERQRSDVPYIGPDRPGDEYNDRGDVHALITRHGFHTPRNEPDGSVSYRAPHRGPKDGTGATVYPDGHVAIWSETFAANHPNVRPHWGYRPFNLYAALEHGGDFGAAASALRAQGFGAGVDIDPFGRSNHIIEAAPTTSPPPQVDPETGEVIEDVEDDGPIPLDNVDLPAFPLDVLPPWIRSEVVACSESLSVPIEIPAGLALVALSTACAGKIDVDGINYHQPTNLWLSIIAASGVGKSPAADRMLGPLYDLDEQLRTEASEEVARAAAEAAAIDEQVAAAKALLKKDPTSESARRAMADAMFAQSTHEAIRPHRLFMDDHTPEALSVVLAEQRTHRMAILSPEGAGLFSTMTGTRYKTNDLPEVPGVYLKSWGGEPLPIDRKGSEPIMVKRPILTVGVLVQPAVVDRLAMTPMIAEQGALARFLWIVAADNVGTRDRRRRRNAARQSPEYVEQLVAMARRCLSWQMPATITATEEAADHLDDVNDRRERRMGLGGDLDAYRAVEAKLVGYQWRLAALLAVAWDDHRDDGISVERARQAEALADYFLDHSIAVHRRAGLGEHGGTLRAVAGYMTQHAGEELDWRDFQLKMRSTGKLVDLQADIAQLIELRWLRADEPVDISAIGVQRRPNPTLYIDARLRALSRPGGVK